MKDVELNPCTIDFGYNNQTPLVGIKLRRLIEGWLSD